MMRKCFALLLIFLQATGPAFASVLTVDEVSVIGAAADDYYTGSKAKLKILEGGKVGPALVTQAEVSSTAALSGLVAGAAGIAGIAYYERTGQDPMYALANAVGSAADALFVPAYQAFKANFVSPESYPSSAAQWVGLEGSVGGLLGDAVSLAKAHPDNYPDFNTLLASHTTASDLGIGSGSVGQIFEAEDGNTWQITGTWSGPYTNGSATGMVFLGTSSAYDFYSYGTTTIKRCPGGSAPAGCYPLYMANATKTTLDPNVEPIPGTVNFEGLKNDLQSPSDTVKQEIKDIVRNLPTEQKITSTDPSPSTVPAQSPSPITNNQIQNFFAENTTNVYNQYLTNAANGTATDADKAAAETAAQQEDEVQNESEDTYSPLSSNPFQEAYNPGEFDIPARLTTFLSNIKSSGLFSFSSDFFSSLPGGGSSVFIIEGGTTFGGTHSIDLSDTMTGGLAVAKAVLLALFGFLSIRAIIMKR